MCYHSLINSQLQLEPLIHELSEDKGENEDEGEVRNDNSRVKIKNKGVRNQGEVENDKKQLFSYGWLLQWLFFPSVSLAINRVALIKEVLRAQIGSSAETL